jgi:hypothetical protein
MKARSGQNSAAREFGIANLEFGKSADLFGACLQRTRRLSVAVPRVLAAALVVFA